MANETKTDENAGTDETAEARGARVEAGAKMAQDQAEFVARVTHLLNLAVDELRLDATSDDPERIASSVPLYLVKLNYVAVGLKGYVGRYAKELKRHTEQHERTANTTASELN